MGGETEQERRYFLYRISLIVLILLWIIGTIVIAVGDYLWTEHMHEQVSEISYIGSSCWAHTDRIGDPDYNPGDDRNHDTPVSTMVMFMDLFGEKNLVFDREYFEENGNSSLFDHGDTLSDRFFCTEGFEYYNAYLVTDLNGNPIKPLQAFAVEQSPCLSVGEKSGQLLFCKDNMIGLMDPEKVFTEEEFREIGEIVGTYPAPSVAVDRYGIIPGLFDEYVPLSLIVFDQNGNEVLHMDLSHNANLIPEGQISEEWVYLHDPESKFVPDTKTEELQRAEMTAWVGEMQQNPPTGIDIAHDRYESPEYHTFCSGLGPVHRDTAVYYGNNIIVYEYFYSSMMPAYTRIFFSFWGVFSVICLIFFLTFLVLVLRIRKEVRGAAANRKE